MSTKIWIKYDNGEPQEYTNIYRKKDPISKLKPEEKYCVIKHDGKVLKRKKKIPVTTKKKHLHFISEISKSTILLLLP